jgi:hypothetical protein
MTQYPPSITALAANDAHHAPLCLGAHPLLKNWVQRHAGWEVEIGAARQRQPILNHGWTSLNVDKRRCR